MSTRVRQNANTQKLRYITFTGLFAAVIYAFTAFFHVPTGLGYIHIGDAFIYLAGAILPAPYAMAAGAIGGGLSDALSGYVSWVPGTVIIKAVTAMCFSCKGEKIVSKRNLLGIIPAFAACVLLYMLYQGLFLSGGISSKGFWAAIINMPSNCLQSVGSAIVFVVLGLALDKSKIKERTGFSK